MEDALVLETTFLIDLERELARGKDLWIAATAVAHDVPVVTRNARHYRRVPGLEVTEYAADAGGNSR